MVEGFGLAGENGNFEIGEGYALLVNAICDSTGGVLEHRQTGHGYQFLEGCQ